MDAATSSRTRAPSLSLAGKGMNGQLSAFPISGGEMGALIRARDWSATPLGPYEHWPEGLRSILDVCLGSPTAIAITWGADLRLFYNDAYLNMFEAMPDGLPIGEPATKAWADALSVLAPVMTRGETIQARDVRVILDRRGRSDEFFFSYSHSPVRDASGAIVGVFTVVYETTDRVREDRRQSFLLRLGDRLRELVAPRDVMYAAAEALGRHLGVSTAGYAIISSDGLNITLEGDWAEAGRLRPNPRPCRISLFGVAMTGAISAGERLCVEDVVADPRFSAPETQAALAAAGSRAILIAPLRGRGGPNAYFYMGHAEPRRWSDEDVALTEEVIERTWAAVHRAEAEKQLRDTIDELRQLQHEQQVLLGELQHRTRNLLGVIRSIGQQTFERCASMEAGRVQFNNRLTALGRVQTLFAQHDDRAITIGDLVRLELDALAPDGARERMIVCGPSVRLRKTSVQTLALAIHELATNALKHGAFSTPAGKLSVTWRAYGAASARRLALEWVESGLCEAADGTGSPPSGFGRELIEKALPHQLGALTSFELRREGVHCSIDLPLRAR